MFLHHLEVMFDFTPQQISVMVVQFFTAVPAIMAWAQSRSNAKRQRVTSAIVDTVHAEVKANTIATENVARSVNGKLDRALAKRDD